MDDILSKKMLWYNMDIANVTCNATKVLHLEIQSWWRFNLLRIIIKLY